MDRVGIIATVRAPTSQLHLFVNYHLNIGVDKIILFFDDPQDEGIPSFSQYSQVHTVACSSDYWRDKTGDKPEWLPERQIVNVNEGAKVLAATGCSWLIHIDNDELINPLLPLKQLLSRSDADGVRFSIFEAVSEQEKYNHIFLPTLFKKNANKIQLWLAEKIGCSNAIFDGEYFRGHTASKMALKISPKIKEYGIHGPQKGSGIAIENTKNIQLLHFDCVDIDSWKLKLDRQLDGSAKANTWRDNRRRQLFLYKKAKEEGDLQLSALFRKMRSIGKRERIVLTLLGMLKSINLNQKLFEHQDIKLT